MARGFCILAMIAVHLLYDLTELYALLPRPGAVFRLVKNYGSIAFFLLSGICVTLGSHHLRRGMLVLGSGMLVSAGVFLAGSLPIRFGVLHCMGLCMILWSLFRRMSAGRLLYLGICSVSLGIIFEESTVSAGLLYPLGLTAADFVSADFFPLFPYLGYFLWGSCLGRTLYKNRQSLFPCRFSGPVSRFFCYCGRHALLLYLIHQPLLILFIESAIFIGGHFHET